MRRKAFTLVELLVVITIVLIVSAAVIPSVMSAVGNRQINEAARMLQASLVGARDRAMKAGQPCGIRLLPDPAFSNRPGTAIQASNAWINIETAPDYTTGRVDIRTTWDATYQSGYAGGAPALVVHEAWADASGMLRNEATSWAWNIRVGDKLRFGDSGRYYHIVGPRVQANPEGFINYGPPGTAPPTDPNGNPTEFLFLVDGRDDDLNGYVDDGFDGIDSNYNGVVDEPGEWEVEQWGGPQQSFIATGTPIVSQAYTISRRAVPTLNGQTTTLPSEIVIDLTTFNTTQERSRVPVDPVTNYVEVMVNPNGQVIPTMSYSSPTIFHGRAAYEQSMFLHFWLAERKDVVEPVVTAGVPYTLPMPETAYDIFGQPSGYAGTQFLTGERMLVTVRTRNGNTVANTIEFFSASDLGMPYYAAETDSNEAK